MVQLAAAQTNRTARGGPGIASPVIEEGHKVMFRLLAPKAGTVTLTGDFLEETHFLEETPRAEEG
jgi:hypothetical protein